MKAGDLVRHKTFGYTGLILKVDPRSTEISVTSSDYLLIVWSDWPNLPQANNHTWTMVHDAEVINASG
ncbi:MAG TPA: hypothetical protein EYN27_12900 [Rhodospirillales bacterium]|nr:hypothetical protein [Rhodospirillales bacterium]